MRISDWSSDVFSSDLVTAQCLCHGHQFLFVFVAIFIQAGDDLRRHQGKATLLVVVLAVVLGSVGGGEAEMHRATVFELEAVIAEVLAALGVVLILVDRKSTRLNSSH